MVLLLISSLIKLLSRFQSSTESLTFIPQQASNRAVNVTWQQFTS